MKDIEVPVLIVGGGPVGLLGGVLLAQQGIPSLTVERRESPQRSPAAHVVSARTFEICRAAGVDEKALRAAASDPADASRVRWMTTLTGTEIASLPFERQGDEVLEFTPTPLRNLSQNRFEPIVLDAVHKAPGAEITYGHAWEGAEQDDDGVVSRVRDLALDRVYTVRSRYLLGTDGAGSRVRKSIGIEMDGPPQLNRFLMIHVGADLRSRVGEHPAALFWICDPEAGGAFIGHDIDREWVYMRDFGDDETLDDYPPERCEALVRRALGDDQVPLSIENVGTWTMTTQVADHYREGRIFLAGDSAHRFPPTGGLGLNTGAQDIHGLAWKLAAVLHGWAPASLLDSYEVERRPVARNNAAQSLRNALKMIEVPRAFGTIDEPTTARMEAALADRASRAEIETAIENQAEHFDMLGLQLGFVYEDGALAREDEQDAVATRVPENPVREYLPTGRPGARLPHAWIEREGEQVSTLDLLWPQGFTLLTTTDDPAWENAMAALGSLPVRGVSVDAGPRWASEAGIEPGGALLVRPDQHVAWRTRTRPTDPTAALRSAMAEVLGREA